VNPIMWGITAAATVVTMWHAVTEHHMHLRLLRHFRSGTLVPETTHDTWWHSLPKNHRIAVQAALMTVGLVCAIAYEAMPAAAVAVLGVIVIAGAALLAIRSADRKRSRPMPEPTVSRIAWTECADAGTNSLTPEGAPGRAG
jgi:hypothetical protein